MLFIRVESITKFMFLPSRANDQGYIWISCGVGVYVMCVHKKNCSLTNYLDIMTCDILRMMTKWS